MLKVVIVVWSGSILAFAIAWILGEIPFAWVFYVTLIGGLFYLPFSGGRGGGDVGGWSSGDGGGGGNGGE